MKKMKTMTEGVIWKEILFFAIPLILGNLFQQLYNTVDSIIVGNYVGSNALAAVGSSGAIINLLIGFCIGASTGAGVVISQFYGAKNTEGVRKAVHTTMAIALVAGVLLTVIGITMTPSMLRLMGTPDKVFEQSVIYLQVYFGGSLFSVVYNMSAGVLNAVGNSRRSLVYLMIAAISNIFLDLIMVVGLKLGIVGAALATDISQLISCIFIWGFLIRSEDVYKLKIKEIRCYDHLLFKIIRIGIPTGIQNIVISLSNLIVQTSVNSFGATVMAGFAAYIKIDGFNILPVLSISMGRNYICGTEYWRQKAGQGQKRNVYIYCDGGWLFGVNRDYVADICSTGDRCLYDEPEGCGVWCIYYEVFLPVLLDAWNSACAGRNDTRNRQDDAGNGRISGIFVWIPCDVDCGNNGMDKKSRTCDDVLSDVLASGNATDAFVCMERKMDGSVRPGKIRLF